MGPRANFECRQCAAVESGDPKTEAVVIYEDLPIQATRCPVCGHRRGFKRRFDAIQVSTKGHRIAVVLDPMMEPSINQASMARDAAKASEKILADAHERAVAVAPEAQRPIMRQALQGGPTRWLNQGEAKQSLGMIPPAARSETRTHIWPHIRRKVRTFRQG